MAWSELQIGSDDVAANIDSVIWRKDQIKATFSTETDSLKNWIVDTADPDDIKQVLTKAQNFFREDNNFQNIFSNRNLKKGSIPQGAGFTLALQIALKKLKKYTGKIDGSYGPLTKDAVIKFQAEKGLGQDGAAGFNTLTALIHALGGEEVVDDPEEEKNNNEKKEKEEEATVISSTEFTDANGVRHREIMYSDGKKKELIGLLLADVWLKRVITLKDGTEKTSTIVDPSNKYYKKLIIKMPDGTIQTFSKLNYNYKKYEEVVVKKSDGTLEQYFENDFSKNGWDKKVVYDKQGRIQVYVKDTNGEWIEAGRDNSGQKDIVDTEALEVDATVKSNVKKVCKKILDEEPFVGGLQLKLIKLTENGSSSAMTFDNSKFIYKDKYISLFVDMSASNEVLIEAESYAEGVRPAKEINSFLRKNYNGEIIINHNAIKKFLVGQAEDVLKSYEKK